MCLCVFVALKMKRFNRIDRVSELIHREVANIIDLELKDTRVGMVTVTGVEVSKDIRNARIYVSVLGNSEETASSLAALNNAAAFIRSRLKIKVILRYIPELRFYFDSSTVDGMRIDKILDQISKG